MAKSYPIHLDFLDNTIFVELRFDSFKVGTSEYPGLRIGATYGLEIKGDKIMLVRQGKLQLKPPKKSAEDIAKDIANQSTEDSQPKSRRRGVRQQIFRSLARKRFDPIFAEALNVGSTRRSIGGNSMTIAKIETSDDWITLQAVME